MSEPTKTPRVESKRFLVGIEPGRCAWVVSEEDASTLERELNEAAKERNQWKALAEELYFPLNALWPCDSNCKCETSAALTRFREMNPSKYL